MTEAVTQWEDPLESVYFPTYKSMLGHANPWVQDLHDRLPRLLQGREDVPGSDRSLQHERFEAARDKGSGVEGA